MVYFSCLINYYRPNGQIYEGNWYKNSLNGSATIHIPGKEAILTEWKNGTLVKSLEHGETTVSNN